MAKVSDKMNELMITAYVKACNAWDNFTESERGDTNFISILIILGIVVAVATVFMGFKDQIVTKVSTAISNFISTL
ncbi:MAG: hypothetical protein K2G89_00110 [Lachnospiraceae bacterium]|nr:hypothetical protein [Lachnospiraceae bacterium]